jgi:hypothetical protein
VTIFEILLEILEINYAEPKNLNPFQTRPTSELTQLFYMGIKLFLWDNQSRNFTAEDDKSKKHAKTLLGDGQIQNLTLELPGFSS